MKSALAGVSPFAFNALRLTVSALTLGIADRLEARGRVRSPIPWGAVAGLALLTSLVYQVLFISGIEHTSAGHSGFLIASGPLWTALLARGAGVDHPSRRAWTGLVLAFLGTSVVALATGGNRSATLFGNALMLLATITWASGTVWSRHVLEHFSATRLAFLTNLLALPGHWFLASGSLARDWSGGQGALDGATWAAIVYSGVFSTGLAYVLWNWSVRRLGPSRTSAFVNIVPVCSLVVAWIFLGERPGSMQLAGGGLIVLGLALWGLEPSKAAPPTDLVAE